MNNASKVIRTEGIALRPFTGLKALDEALTTTVGLVFTTNSGATRLAPGEILSLGADEFDKLGLTLHLTDLEELKRAIDPLVMRDWRDVALFVEAKDRPSSTLKESVVIFSEKIANAPSEIPLNNPGATSPWRPLKNRHTGFEIRVLLVLTEGSEVENPLRPRVKGSILSEVTFVIKPVLGLDVIQPKPLDAQLKSALNLSPETWVYLNPSPDFLEAASFHDALDFYVDKDVLAEIQLLQPGDAEIVQLMLYSNLISGLVTEICRRLNDDGFEELNQDERTSQVIRLVRSKFPDTLSLDLLLDRIKTAPSQVVAEILANPEHSKGLLTRLRTLNGESNVVSDTDVE